MRGCLATGGAAVPVDGDLPGSAFGWAPASDFSSGASVNGTWAADFDATALDNEHKSSVVDRVPAVRIRAGRPYQASFNLPRTFTCIFAYGSARFARPLDLPRALVVLGWACVVSLGSSGCEGGYSAEPTFCDEWCAALRHPSDCAEGPASCVRDCELTKASGDCFARQEQLLTCYEALEPDAFSCAPPGSQSSFGDRQRVEKDACRVERDALFECEAPGFGECLELCRGYQAILTEGAVGEYMAGAPSDDCPLLTQPCETVCWTAFLFTSDDLERLRLPPAPGRGESTSAEAGTVSGPGPDGGVGSGDPFTELFAPCLQLGGIDETTP